MLVCDLLHTTTPKKCYFSTTVLKFLGICLAGTTWFYRLLDFTVTPSTVVVSDYYAYRVPQKKMKKHKHDKIKWFLNMFKNFNTTYFAWCTFKRVDSFFDLILVWGSIFELLCPVVVFNNRLYNLIRNRVGPHSQLENEMTLVHEKQSFSVWFFLFIYTYSIVDK